MRIDRALRQQLEDLQLAGLGQLPAASPDRAQQLLEILEAAGAEADPDNVAAAVHETSESHIAASSKLTASADPSTPAVTVTSKPVAGDQQQRLDVICDEVRACELCPELVANRSQTVFGVGNPEARICFFGEGPGADEDRLGEPFVGAAGQLLNKIITACKLERSDVYILNTVKCRPPGNRNPTDDEVVNCRPFYERQLEVIRPEFIVCLGGVAAKALLDTDASVGRLRGKLHEWRFAKVLVTYHPAYLLRTPEAKRKVWDDMRMMLREAGIQL